MSQMSGSDGAVPDGAVPDGAVPDGAVSDGAVSDTVELLELQEVEPGDDAGGPHDPGNLRVVEQT